MERKKDQKKQIFLSPPFFTEEKVCIRDIKMNECCQLNVSGSSQHTSQTKCRGLSYTL